MMNQSARQEAIRAATGKALDYNGDWHALFDLDGVAAGPFNARLLDWINTTLGSSYAGLTEAMQGWAAACGGADWDALAGNVLAARGTGPLLMSSRFAMPGSLGYAGSDGTDVDGNTRLSSWNELGVRVTKMSPLFANWRIDTTNEAAGYNEIDVDWSVRTAGTGVVAGDDLTIATNANGQGAAVSAVVEAGAQFWVQDYAEVGAGERWPQTSLIAPGNTEAADFNTHVDKSPTGATITNAGSASAGKQGYGPSAMLAVEWEGTPHAIRVFIDGDSLHAGTTFGRVDTRGGYGPIASALGGLRPYIQGAFTGRRAELNQEANLAKRVAFALAAGCSYYSYGFGINDLRFGRSAAQTLGYIQAATTFLIGLGFKVVLYTVPPQVDALGANGAETLATQTISASPANAFISGGSVALSQRAILNTAIRAMASSSIIVVDMAAAVESPSVPGKFRTNEAAEGTLSPSLLPFEVGTVSSYADPALTVTGLTAAGTPSNSLSNGSSIVWLTGPNAGVRSPVQSNSQSLVTLTTAAALAIAATPPAAGHTFSCRPAAGRTVVVDGLHHNSGFYNNTFMGGQGMVSYAVRAALGLS